MLDSSHAVVITSIQPPTKGVQAIASRAARVIVVGDRKSPNEWSCGQVEYLSFLDQESLPFASASVLPPDSYTRKMLGYLFAASQGVEWIRETDDDNIPYDSFFEAMPKSISARIPSLNDGWINIYRYFTPRFVWPRGFPLSRVHRTEREGRDVTRVQEVEGPFVLQAVADGDPDVDAIYRLTAPDVTEVRFEDTEPLLVPHESWTPFNSQATTWPRSLLPLMYLPSTCSFRMTDIWRSFIAQRIMSALGVYLVVTPPTVYQERNSHNLMHDFADEIEGYVGYERFVNVLQETSVGGREETLLDDLSAVYRALISDGFFKEPEIPLLDAWQADMRSLGFGG